MYGKNNYGLLKYAQKNGTTEYQDTYFLDISHYVPPFFARTKEFRCLHEAEGNELGLAYHNIRDSLEQCFLDTSAWGLIRWEEMYGITTNLSLSYEQRREMIAARIRGQGTTTRQMIEETAAAFSGGEVEVIEDNRSSLFIVRFVGIKGIPRNMQSFIDMLEDVKPAHLAYRFEYRYTLWNDIQGVNWTWGSLSDKTYDEVKVMKGV